MADASSPLAAQAHGSSSTADALLTSLGAKAQRVSAQVQELETEIQTASSHLASLQKEQTRVNRESARVTEMEHMATSMPDAPSWRKVASEAAPESVLLLCPPESSSSSSAPLVVAVDPRSSLAGKVVHVEHLSTARCIAAFLRGGGFIPPSHPGSLAETMHVASSALGGAEGEALAKAVRDFVLHEALGEGSGAGIT